jgi:hypothetical protein
MGICVHATLWQQARIGMQPDVASGRCVQLRLCPSTRLPRGQPGIARLRDRIRRLRATCIRKEDQQIMQSMIIRPKHISVRNPQAPGPRSRSALCSRRRRHDARIPPIFADHLRSSVLCIQCRQARGGSHSWRSLFKFAPACPGNGFSLREWGYWYTFFYFDLTEGSQGISPFDFRHYRQTRFGHHDARGERRRPQFTAQNSVRPFENGLVVRSLGSLSSATRPLRRDGGRPPAP